MSRLRRWRGLGTFLGLVALLATHEIRAEDGPRGARWVGADAAIYLEVTHPDTLVDRLTGDQFQRLLDAVPGYEQALRGNDYRKFRAVVDLVASNLGTTWEQGLRDLAGG